ncbi:MAG: DUF624 domain-containing protein [Rhodobacteraceae bacterium]|nr:DUF624 domain-containing protein [Paracoccaceae bacterium]PHR53594.1 MAG: hypothetical protein COA47_16715 [Robiginitomaculum sp.]
MKWWLNLYFAEGPGIAKDLPRATGLRLVWQTIAREWWNLIILNVVFITASLPIVTIPAAYAAMVRVTATMVEDEPCEPWRDFREAFITLLLPSLSLSLLCAAMVGLGAAATRAYAQAATESLAFAVPLAIAAAFLGLVTLFTTFAFTLLATQRPLLPHLLKAAAIAVLVRPLPVLAALGANAALWVFHIAAYPSTILLAVLVNFSFGTLLITFATLATAQASLAYARSRNEEERIKTIPPIQTGATASN